MPGLYWVPRLLREIRATVPSIGKSQLLHKADTHMKKTGTECFDGRVALNSCYVRKGFLEEETGANLENMQVFWETVAGKSLCRAVGVGLVMLTLEVKEVRHICRRQAYDLGKD